MSQNKAGFIRTSNLGTYLVTIANVIAKGQQVISEGRLQAFQKGPTKGVCANSQINEHGTEINCIIGSCLPEHIRKTEMNAGFDRLLELGAIVVRKEEYFILRHLQKLHDDVVLSKSGRRSQERQEFAREAFDLYWDDLRRTYYTTGVVDVINTI